MLLRFLALTAAVALFPTAINAAPRHHGVHEQTDRAHVTEQDMTRARLEPRKDALEADYGYAPLNHAEEPPARLPVAARASASCPTGAALLMTKTVDVTVWVTPRVAASSIATLPTVARPPVSTLRAVTTSLSSAPRVLVPTSTLRSPRIVILSQTTQDAYPTVNVYRPDDDAPVWTSTKTYSTEPYGPGYGNFDAPGYFVKGYERDGDRRYW
ncbi:hypothetical protein CDD81_2974 [Ophiocordyceps australis]|uniref:Uncharacterized protein n=1 Tax=Ophiocordyceps australis TaxID=1399860 RepID=A0A2C5YCG6_9HYPO|nr:hypothetical protein CDD81_2974 [Ophiocordyceps australis]